MSGFKKAIIFAIFSLAPGFSRVFGAPMVFNRFSGFPTADKPLKRLSHRAVGLHPAKAGC
jgi:hypothetical protein